MNQFKAQEYIKITKKNPEAILKRNMRAELQTINKIKNLDQKTIIDLGAGHGRVLNHLASHAKNVIAIELNKDMFKELKRRSLKLKKVKVIRGDITNLFKIIKKEKISTPVILLLQNTLGTIHGKKLAALSEMKKITSKNKGEIIISLFKQEALRSWGMRLYKHKIQLNGPIDTLKTNFAKGIL